MDWQLYAVGLERQVMAGPIHLPNSRKPMMVNLFKLDVLEKHHRRESPPWITRSRLQCGKESWCVEYSRVPILLQR